jgi:hypothetical protein
MNKKIVKAAANTTRKMTYRVNVRVFENGKETFWPHYTGQECDALEDCILSVLNSVSWNLVQYSFEMNEEDESMYIVCRDTLTDKRTTFSDEILNMLVGELIFIKPRQYGVTPWPPRVEIMLEALP